MIVALELPVIVVVVTVKLTDVAPAGTVTDGATVNVVLEFERVTLAPPAGAAPLSLTVHVELLALLRLAGEHDMELTDSKAWVATPPPVEERAT